VIYVRLILFVAGMCGILFYGASGNQDMVLISMTVVIGSTYGPPPPPEPEPRFDPIESQISTARRLYVNDEIDFEQFETRLDRAKEMGERHWQRVQREAEMDQRLPKGPETPSKALRGPTPSETQGRAKYLAEKDSQPV
jgi:hypothetical protein